MAWNEESKPADGFVEDSVPSTGFQRIDASAWDDPNGYWDTGFNYWDTVVDNWSEL